LVALASLVSFGACDEGGSQNSGGSGGSAKQGSSSSGDTFKYALSDDPETFDTAKMSGAPEGRVAFNVFEGLLMPAQTTKGATSSKELTRPGMAKSYEVSDDGTTYTFQLRKDAKWSDGHPVTAEDFAFAWKRVLTPGFPADYAQLMYVVKNAEEYNSGKVETWSEVGVETPDEHTVVVHLERPTPFFPELAAFYTFFPQPKHVVEKHGDDWTREKNIVSNGAYTLDTYKPQRHIKLKKNSKYWEADDVSIENTELRIIKDRNAVVNAFKAGKLHWTGAGLPIAQISDLIMRPDYFREPMLGVYYYRINVEKDSPLTKPKVRRALSLAIDRKSIVKTTMKGLYKTAEAFVPSNLSGYESTATVSYDPKKAKELLKEAGHPGGEDIPTFSVLYNTDKNHKRVAVNIQNMWKKNLGIDVELVNTEWKTYLERVDNLNYEIARAGWIGDYNDPMTFLSLWETGNGNNDTGWSNEQYDELLDKARSESDPNKRREYLQKAEALVLNKGPVIPVYEYSSNMLLNEKVEGFEPHNRNIHLVKDLSFKE
jgi:oligopeptide transport system substrate-binding protein